MALVAALFAATASAGNDEQLIARINEYRDAPETCNGEQAGPAGPLAPDDRLAQLETTSGTRLQAALQESGYQAAALQVVGISGPASIDRLMQVLKQRYCQVLLNPEFAEIGVSRSGNSWQLVLARPLLAGDLGDWRQAGKQVLEQVNQARAQPRQCGDRQFEAAPPVAWNARLAQAALAHSRDMAEHNYFSHTGKDGSLAHERAGRAGYKWRRIGENIAAGQGAAKQVVSGWLASPGHCANVMNPAFTEMGAAYVSDARSDAQIYWTQVFGRPR